MLIKISFIFLSFAFSQYFPQEWNSITSFLTPVDIEVSDNEKVYISTSGGLLEFDPFLELFKTISTKDGLIYLDIASMELDNKGRIWIGGSYPNGFMQVYDPIDGLISKVTHLDIMEVSQIKNYSNKVFAIYKGSMSNETGILVFDLDEDGLPDYKDYYNNFDVNEIANINDLDIYNEMIFVSTQNAVYAGSLANNLKQTTNWEKIYSTIDNSNILFIPNDINHLVKDDSVYFFENEIWNSYDIKLSGRAISADFISDKLSVLTQQEYYEFFNYEADFIFSMPNMSQQKSSFTSFAKSNSHIYLGIDKSGIISVMNNSASFNNYIPNTPFNNEYNALALLENGELACVSKYGLMIWNGNVYKNYLPWQYSVFTPDWREDSINNQLRWTYLNYLSSEHLLVSIIEKKNGVVMYPNSGIIPNQSDWLESPALIELDYKLDQVKYFGNEDNIIDGMFGIYSPEINSNYMVVNQIKKDYLGNIWIINPFCEKNGNLIAIQSNYDEAWDHVTVPDSSSFRPQSIDFDHLNRAWIGFAYDGRNLYNNPQNSNIYSNGGLKVYDYNNSKWILINNLDMLPGNDQLASVWSVVFDKMNFLWVMSEKGIRGFTYSLFDNEINLLPLINSIEGIPIDFLSNISFEKGNRIKVDAENNKWIITYQGLWVIQESMAFWPSIEGLNVENSGLLSNKVYDVTFDNDEGLAYLATDKGISILQIPFSETPKKSDKMYISPNPFIYNEHEVVLIKNISAGSTIQIMTVSGKMVKVIKLPNNQSQAIWDGKDSLGNRLGTGVYIVAAYHPKERDVVSKIAIIR